MDNVIPFPIEDTLKYICPDCDSEVWVLYEDSQVHCAMCGIQVDLKVIEDGQ